MGGFRFSHLIAAGAPEGARAAWSPLPSVSQYISAGNGSAGVPIYIAPLWSKYDSQGLNPDGPPKLIQTILNVAVVVDETIAADALASNIDFFLYRAGSVVGGGRFAGFDSGSNPALTLGAVEVVPFDITNTALRPVPALGQTSVVSATSALLPVEPGDVVFAITTDTGVMAVVNAQ